MSAYTEDALERAPVVSRHNWPQPSPQEWDCGCVTATYVTDRDASAREQPFEMRLAHKCSSGLCAVRRAALNELLVREDLLSSRDWPWTTETILRAYVALQIENRRFE